MKFPMAVLTVSFALAALVLCSGCVAAIGNRSPNVTVGQQLIDLQKAKEAGALTEAEFQTQKARLLGSN
jgi:hypothetical protein